MSDSCRGKVEISDLLEEVYRFPFSDIPDHNGFSGQTGMVFLIVVNHRTGEFTLDTAKGCNDID